MNTLSPQDSVGYYLPVSISDYNVNYRGFDHIELQYKLSTQSDDGWVNLCSYYADSALYAAASGNKAMIQGGSINPMETQNLIFTVNEDLPVGVYSEIIYLTDENDLSEPLKVLIEVRAVCPWENVSPQQFAEWDGDHWVGTLSHVDYHQMYMLYSHRDHLGTQVSGRRLTNSSERTITLQHGWNSFP